MRLYKRLDIRDRRSENVVSKQHNASLHFRHTKECGTRTCYTSKNLQASSLKTSAFLRVWSIGLALIFALGLVSAAEAEIVMIDDIGSFSGAILRIKSPVTGDVGDKIYASEYLTSVGIVKFEIETSLEEVLLTFAVSKNGVIVSEFVAGPFAVNGSEILIDRREKVELEVIKIVGDMENISEELEVVSDEESNVSEEEAVGSELIVVEDSAEVNLLRNKLSSILLTGRAIFVRNDGSVNMGYSIGGSAFVLMFIVFVFMMIKHGKRKEVEVLSEDDKELAYMEKKVKATEAKISRVKDERIKKKKIVDAKVRLAKEKKELEELEAKERGESEKIEDVD